MDTSAYPLHVFRFRVDFYESNSDGNQSGGKKPLCSGRFAECRGIEATMEPKSIKVGGLNTGVKQRAGRVNFSTVILKRGITNSHDLWKWFELISGGAYAYRLDVEVSLLDFKDSPEAPGVMTWKMKKALPTKFRAAEFNAKAQDVGIEELHFVHEGLTLTGSTGGQ